MLSNTEIMYEAIDILSIIDGAELVRIVNDRWLCVWFGGAIDGYDLTKDSEPDIICVPMLGNSTPSRISDIIDAHYLDREEYDEI